MDTGWYSRVSGYLPEWSVVSSCMCSYGLWAEGK